MSTATEPPFDPQAVLSCAPWRLSGLVVGVLLNDPAEHQALGPALHAPPYTAPPRQPVLYLKPRNTLMAPTEPCALPPHADALVCGASLGLVIGDTINRAQPERALQAVAALLVAVDLFVPHSIFYRPAVRLRSLDASCRLSRPQPWHPATGPNPDDIALSVTIEDRCIDLGATAQPVRSAGRLLADISAFMTLRPGDVVLTGVRLTSPMLRSGQRATVHAAGVGTVPVAVASAHAVPRGERLAQEPLS